MQKSAKISIQEVEGLLDEGKTRKEIAEHFGYPASVLAKTIFQDPRLKNRKRKKIYNIELVDENENTTSETEDLAQIGVEEAQDISSHEAQQEVEQDAVAEEQEEDVEANWN